MRARNIKPSIFKNEFLARLAQGSFRAFTGLWCLADRKGRLEDRPDRIEAEIFPFKFQKINIEKILDGLASGPEPFIVRYEVDKKRYIQIINFEKHQFPHHREKESVIPSPGKAQGQTKESPILAHLNPESPILNPDPPLVPQSKDKEKIQETFKTFYAAYPKKHAREKALGAWIKAWEKLDFSNGLFQKILNAIEVHKKTDQWLELKGKYIPLPATWINQRRWEDEVTIAGNGDYAQKEIVR